MALLSVAAFHPDPRPLGGQIDLAGGEAMQKLCQCWDFGGNFCGWGNPPPYQACIKH